MAQQIHDKMTNRLAAMTAAAFLALALLSGAACPTAAAGEHNVAKMICPAGKKAKQKQHLQEALARIADGGSPDAVIEDGKTALHLAAMAQNHLAICWLIAKGADLQATDGEGKFFFDYIQAEGAREGVKSMCQQTDRFAKATRRDWEMVIDQMNDEKAMKAMPSRFAPYMLAISVRTGMDINMTTAKGSRWSVRKGMDSTLARLLLALGWQAESPTPAQQLLYAVLSNEVKTMKNLLKEHPELLATEEYDLLMHVQSGAMLKALLAAGANIKARPAQARLKNQLVLDAINIGADKTVVDALLKAGAGIPLEANTQSTGLHYVCGDANVDSEMVAALVKGGANVNAKNTSGNTPLHVACMMGNPPMVEALMAIGADASIKNNEGNTPEQVIGKGNPMSDYLRMRTAEALKTPRAKK